MAISVKQGNGTYLLKNSLSLTASEAATLKDELNTAIAPPETQNSFVQRCIAAQTKR